MMIKTVSPFGATGQRRGRGTLSDTTVWRILVRLAVARLGAGEPLVINDGWKELAPEEAATFQNIEMKAAASGRQWLCDVIVAQREPSALAAISIPFEFPLSRRC